MKIIHAIAILSVIGTTTVRAQWVYFEKNEDGTTTKINPQEVDLSWPATPGQSRRNMLIYNEPPIALQYEKNDLPLMTKGVYYRWAPIDITGLQLALSQGDESNRYFDEAEKTMKKMPYETPRGKGKRNTILRQAELPVNMGGAQTSSGHHPGEHDSEDLGAQGEIDSLQAEVDLLETKARVQEQIDNVFDLSRRLWGNDNILRK